MTDIDVFNEVSDNISVELHELTELLSISDSSDSIVVIWDISSQMELNEVTKSTNSEHVKLLLLWLVTVSILSVTVSIEDVIVCSLEILSLIMSWVISDVGLIVFVVEGSNVDTLVQAVFSEFGVEVVVVESEVEVDVMDGVSVSLNVSDGDAVIELDVEEGVIIEDGKLDRDVKPGDIETVIDGKIDSVDILDVVESRVVGWSIETGFSGVFGGNIVDDLVVVSIADVELIL